MSTNGKRPDDLALRPALAEIMDRQKHVLERLGAPLSSTGVREWKSEAVAAGVGRISDGLRALLADHDMSPVIERYYTDAAPEAEEFRLLMREALSVEYAAALQDMSRISIEAGLRAGMGTAALHIDGAHHGARFR